MARGPIDALAKESLKPKVIKTIKTGKTTKTTITFDGEDEKEIFRIQDELRDRGIRCNEVTQTIRIALRVAFAEKADEEIENLCGELSEKWKRGGK